MIATTPHPEGTAIKVKAYPGARKNAVLGERNGALRIAVTAAPEQGKANDAIVWVLAQALQCRRSEIALLTGLASRDKTFLVTGLSPDVVSLRLSSPHLKNAYS